MDILKAKNIAGEYLEQRIINYNTSLRFVVNNPKEFYDCFYFDLSVIPADINTTQDQMQFGGASGISVDKKSGKAEVITFSRLCEIETKEAEIKRLVQMIKENQLNGSTLIFLKNKFNLTSTQLSGLKRKLENSSYVDEQIVDSISSLFH